MSKPVVGAQLYTLRDFLKTEDDIKETFEKVRNIGYTEVQLSGVGPIEPITLGNILKDTGLSAAATHMSWDRFLNDLDAVIEEHKTWDCKHAAIGGLDAKYFCDDGVKMFLDELAPVSEALAKEGMDFSYHNHNHEFIHYNGRAWLDTLYSEAPADMLKAELDVYWVQAGGADPCEWIWRCAGREPVMHLKDMCIVPEREQRFAEIGQGNLNWDGIFSEAEDGGVEHFLVEQDNCYDRDPFESLAISYKFLEENGYK
jgi:sugar phosphate isomerase/epimerase